jgi:small nuclear ribonucleoprotein (snRNP)-like protein
LLLLVAIFIFIFIFPFLVWILANIALSLQIEVCLPDDFRVVGVLNRYNLHYNIALVEIMGYWGARAIKISGHQLTSSMNVVAVGSLFVRHNLIMATEGEVLIGKKSKLDCVELCVSTCKITKVFFVDFPSTFNM